MHGKCSVLAASREAEIRSEYNNASYSTGMAAMKKEIIAGIGEEGCHRNPLPRTHNSLVSLDSSLVVLRWLSTGLASGDLEVPLEGWQCASREP